MKPRLRSTFWEARWTRADGLPGNQPGFKTEIEAREYGDEQRIQAKRDRRAGKLERRGKELTLQQYLVEHYSVTLDVKDRTAEDYEFAFNSHILPKFGKYPLSQITAEEIGKWRVEQKHKMKRDGENYSPKTLGKIEGMLATVIKQAVNYDYLVKNPFNKIDRKYWTKQIKKREPKVLNFEQLLQIIDQSPERLHALMWLGFFTGMRPSEFLGLTWDRIDFEKKTITIERQIHHKPTEVFDDKLKSTAAYRTIELDEELVKILIQHRNKFGLGPHQLIFTNARGRVLRYKAALDAFNKAARPLGVPKGDSLHLLRHTCVSHLILIGWEAFEIQHHVGHATYQETMDTYGHLLKSKERFSADTLGEFYRHEMSKRKPKFTLSA